MRVIEGIYRAVLEGRVEEVVDGVDRALAEGLAVQEILNRGLIPAMDRVGERFAEGELFIPQVLWSAKAMQGGMDRLAPHFAEAGQARRETVLIGTVRGDIHDIGKNLVAMLLGASFRVIDLGVDVAPEMFIEKAVAEQADVIGMSALLTTTMPAMGEVVRTLKARGLSGVKTIVGGAPVSESFGREIEADAYGVDAMDAVRKVRALVGR